MANDSYFGLLLLKGGSMDYLIIGIFGSLGAILRFTISGLKFSHIFPIHTLIINLVGCLFAGLLIGFTQKSQNHHLYTLISVGFIGSFTTFSAFGIDTLTLIENKHFLLGGANIILNLAGGVLLIWLGKTLIT